MTSKMKMSWAVAAIALSTILAMAERANADEPITDVVPILHDGATSVSLEGKVLAAGNQLQAVGRNFWAELNRQVEDVPEIDYGDEAVIRLFVERQLANRPIVTSVRPTLALLSDPAATWEHIGGSTASARTSFATAQAALSALIQQYANAVLADSGASMVALAETTPTMVLSVP